jgi:hypothetical protein
MSIRIFDVKLWPGCCHLELVVSENEEFDGSEFSSAEEFAKKHLRGKNVVPMEEAATYQHGDHPFTQVYDIRSRFALYKDPVVFGWVEEDGMAQYLMVCHAS